MTIKIKWKSPGVTRSLNHYRSLRDKRLYDVFDGESGMLKSVSYAWVSA